MALTRISTTSWGGLRTDVAAHLVKGGELTAVRNVCTDAATLKTRNGLRVVRRLAASTTPPRPVALWTLERFGPAPAQVTEDRPENGGLACGFGMAAVPEKLNGGSLEYWLEMNGLPDFCQLGGRLFAGDGVNPNLAFNSQDGTLRPMSCPAQRAALTLTQQAGGSLTATSWYTWGVRRVYTDGSLRVNSAMTLNGATLASGKLGCVLALAQVEYPAPAGWNTEYEIWRCLATDSATLYRVTTLTSFPAGGTYTDTTADTALDMSTPYSVASDDADTTDPNYAFPPCRFLRAWKNRVVGAGTQPYATGTMATTATSKTVTLGSGATVRQADLDANVRIAGESGLFVITAVNTAANAWTLDRACANSQVAVTYVKQHANDVLLVSDALPNNIEGCYYGEEIYAGQGSDNRVTGLAVNGDWCYVLREQRVEVLEVSASKTYALTVLPSSPPGCVSHRTIADQYSPRLYYYAGASGVWQITNGTPQLISLPVQALLENTVLHELDAWTHGVFDPRTGKYYLWLFQSGDLLTAGADVAYLMPSLCLVWDSRRERWTVHDLPAACSGIWKTSSGEPYPVIGIPGGVARLDAGVADGTYVAATVSAGTTKAATVTGTPFTGLDLRGLPCLLSRTDGARAMLHIQSNTANGLTFYETLAAAPAVGERLQVGAFLWHAETGEIGLHQSTDKIDPTSNKKFARVCVSWEPTAAAATLTTTVKGVRAKADHTQAQDIPMQGKDFAEFAGASAGMRGHSVVARVAGTGGQEAQEILVVSVEFEDTQR